MGLIGFGEAPTFFFTRLPGLQLLTQTPGGIQKLDPLRGFL